jgi:hypothetical protein
MANFLGNFVSLMGVPVFYFQNLVTLLISNASTAASQTVEVIVLLNLGLYVYHAI